MAYKCLECGHIFDDGEQAVWEERHGLDTPPYEQRSGCPLCEGSYEETVRCDICGSEHLADELNGGVCDECIDQCRKDFKVCYAVSFGETEEIKINALLASLFDVSDIEQILKEYILAKRKDVDCSQFIDNDISWFGEKLKREVKRMKTKKSNRDEVRENTLCVLLSKDEKESVQNKAEEIGVSMSMFARMVLKDFLKKDGR